MDFRKRGKYLKTWNTGSVLSIASTMGAAKSGSSIAFTDWAKQKVVMVSIVKHRNPESMSDDLPCALFFSRTCTK
jgi:hypothetical protein